MLICGIKVSHDGAVALIDDGRLSFCAEVEKHDNNERYSSLGYLERVGEMLLAEGVDPDGVDVFVVDGWWEEGDPTYASVSTTQDGRPIPLPVAPYVESATTRDPLHRYLFTGHDFARARGYASYHHASNHLAGAYCTSPFAARGEDALVLIWDGGMTPRLYEVHAADGSVRAAGPLMPIAGNMFADFSAQFEPFYSSQYHDYEGRYVPEAVRHHLGIAGKAMAYAGLGTVDVDAFDVFDRLFKEFDTVSRGNAFRLGQRVAAERDSLLPGLSNADIIATFQAFLGDALLTKVSAYVERRFAGVQPNLALAGGCALNIKWNTLLRRSGPFSEIWIPPFPNDAGAAIGTACCELLRAGDHRALGWDVYSGPKLGSAPTPGDWAVRTCPENDLAAILNTEGEPIVVLTGRAELGPRALGHRSILAPAVDPQMKDHLNLIKGRANYRPVAPICLSTRAAEIFDPGCADPYMLFEHGLRPGWAQRVPAIVHLDGTARLQTVEPTDSVVSRILAEYERISGLPVLCNTSANNSGCGFFPDVGSAMAWGRTRYIWSEGLLYTNPDPAVGFYNFDPRETVSRDATS